MVRGAHTMQYTVFGVDQDSTSMNNSFLTDKTMNSSVTIQPSDSIAFKSSDKIEKYICVSDTANSILHEGMLLCQPVDDDNRIKTGDLIVPSWILDILGVPNGSTIFTHSIKIMILDTIKVSKIKLIYKGYKSYRHWDEFAANSRFFIPGAWISEWPTGISLRALTKLLPIILYSKTLVHKSVVVLTVLDVTMVINTNFNEIVFLKNQRFEFY